MPLTPWKTMWGTKFPSLRDEMDRVFEEFFGEAGSPAVRQADWLPAVDVLETDKDVIITMDLPAIDPGEISVSIVGDRLTVSGERKRQSELKEEDYYRAERSYGSFMRTIQLPAEVVGEKAAATYKEGVLTITVPKAQKAVAREIRISVHSATEDRAPSRAAKKRRKNEG